MSHFVVIFDAGCATQPLTATVRVVVDVVITHLSDQRSMLEGVTTFSSHMPLNLTLVKVGLIVKPLPEHGWL
jgi:hypothetical protein